MNFGQGMQSDNSMGCCLVMPYDVSATPINNKSKLDSPTLLVGSSIVSAVNEKTKKEIFQKSKLNITVNNYATKPVLKEVETAEEMMIDLQAMRESLGLTPVKLKEPEKEEVHKKAQSDDDFILEMRSPDEKD